VLDQAFQERDPEVYTFQGKKEDKISVRGEEEKSRKKIIERNAGRKKRLRESRHATWPWQKRERCGYRKKRGRGKTGRQEDEKRAGGKLSAIHPKEGIGGGGAGGS